MEDNSLMQQRKFEILLEMQSKKYEAEINSLKQAISTIAGELSSIKSQVSKKKVEIIDCRPDNEKKGDFIGGSSKNAEPIRPRYGDYTSEDVSIDKFFYYGNKR